VKPKRYTSGHRSADAIRTKAVMLLTYRTRLDGYTAEQFSRETGLSLPEATALLERERLMRGARHG
jgi:hypothetical protein